MDLGHPPSDEAPRGVADQGRALDPDGVQEGLDVGGEVVDGVTAVGALGVAVATLVQGKGAVAVGQQGQEPTEGEPGVGVAVQEHDRLPARVALLGVVDLGAAGKSGGRKPELRNVLWLPPRCPAPKGASSYDRVTKTNPAKWQWSYAPV